MDLPDDTFARDPVLPLQRRASLALRQAYRDLRSNLLWLRLLLTDRRGVVVLQFHSVADADTARFIVPGNRMDRALFEQEMRFIARYRRAIDMDTFLEVLQGRQKPEPGSVLLTFDDGYLDNKTFVAPLLESLHLPAIFYLPTGLLTRGECSWVDHLYSAFRFRSRPRLALDGWPGSPFDLENPEERRAAYQSLAAKMIETDARTRTDLLEQVNDALAPTQRPPRLLMNWSEALELKQAHRHIRLGAHGGEHVDLTSQPAEMVDADLVACKQDFQRGIGEPPMHFAYPYNRSNLATQRALRRHGFRTAMTSGLPILIDASADPLRIGRLDAPNDLARLSRWSAGAFYTRQR